MSGSGDVIGISQQTTYIPKKNYNIEIPLTGQQTMLDDMITDFDTIRHSVTDGQTDVSWQSLLCTLHTRRAVQNTNSS